jgi:hypothetical protein
MARALAPSGGNDVVYTPDDLALDIVNHFKPTGKILEPCKGGGAFLRVMPSADWCEIQEGKDFLTVDGKWDWIVTNPPWSLIRPFMVKSMQVSDNIVFLCLVNAMFMKARMRDMKEYGFGLKELYFLDTPKKPWPQTGFALGACHIQRGYVGDLRMSFQ